MTAERDVISPPLRALDEAGNRLASMAVRGGEFLFVSGLTAVDPQSGQRRHGTTASETRQIL